MTEPLGPLLGETFALVRAALERERGDQPFWEGRLSTSALATATAVSALAMVLKEEGSGFRVQGSGEAARSPGEKGSDPLTSGGLTPFSLPQPPPSDLHLHTRIYAGLAWLAEHQNADGGWGDTPDSASNLATCLLALAAILLADSVTEVPEGILAAAARAETYLNRGGGIGGILRRYGGDRTFSAPILTNAALARLVGWREVPGLPFELAALPRWTFRRLGLRVVSYALPALIAVGLARFAQAPPRSPVTRIIRQLARRPALKRLTTLVPESGGFLEAVPLTAFVVMGLLAARQGDHPAVARGLSFLAAAHRPDGGWPIDVNLSVWNTTLAVNALGEGDAATRDWLLARQVRVEHPFTGAAPGGWGWSHLPGSVPDADDTAGALLALRHLPPAPECITAALAGANWLLGVQNRDGGWPTFCRGWQKLPFDRSAPDLTAHAIRALAAWRDEAAGRLGHRIHRAVRRGLAYLARVQGADGRWVPLWFGNEAAPGERNPVLGTARVLLAYRDLDRLGEAPAQRGAEFLRRCQNADGSWGGDAGVAGSIEETALACEALLACVGKGDGSPLPVGPEGAPACRSRAAGRSHKRLPSPFPHLAAGLRWLCGRILDGGLDQPRPIGLYFARLWYAERLYPLGFSASALRQACAWEGQG